MSFLELEKKNDDNEESKQVKVSRTTFDAACVFGAATLVQVLVPSPLDYFLFPAVAAAWFVQTGQDSWMIDYTYNHAKNACQRARNLATEFINHHKQNALASTADSDEIVGDINDSDE